MADKKSIKRVRRAARGFPPDYPEGFQDIEPTPVARRYRNEAEAEADATEQDPTGYEFGDDYVPEGELDPEVVAAADAAKVAKRRPPVGYASPTYESSDFGGESQSPILEEESYDDDSEVLEGDAEGEDDGAVTTKPMVSERAAKMQADLRSFQRVPMGDTTDEGLVEVDSKAEPFDVAAFKEQPSDARKELQARVKAAQAGRQAELDAEPMVSERAAKLQADLRAQQRVPMDGPMDEGLTEVDSKAEPFDAATFKAEQPSDARKELQARVKAAQAGRQAELDAAKSKADWEDVDAALRDKFDSLDRLREQAEYDEAQVASGVKRDTPDFRKTQEARLAKIAELESATKGETRPAPAKSWTERAGDAIRGVFSSKPKAAQPEASPEPAAPATPVAPDEPGAEDRTGLGGALGGSSKTSVKGSGKGGADDAKLTPLAKNYTPDYADNPLPQFTESTMVIRDPATGEVVTDEQGQAKRMTGLEAFQKYAELQARDIDRQTQEYRAEKDAAKAAAMWTEILRGIAALGAGMYGIKHGVDMSGYKFDPIDWVARQEAERKGYESGVASTREKYQALSDVAKAHTESDALEFNRRMQKFQAIEAKNANELARMNADRDYEIQRKRLANEAWSIGAQWAAVNAKASQGTDPKDVQDLKQKIRGELQKAQQAEADGKADVAEGYIASAKGLASDLNGVDRSGTDWLADSIWNTAGEKSKYSDLPVIGGMFGEAPRAKTGTEVLQSLPGADRVPPPGGAEAPAAPVAASKRHNRDPNNKRTQYLDAKGNVIGEVDGWK